jgi:zinc transport system substrate-binding protein
VKKTVLAMTAAVALTACGSQSEEPAAAPSAEQVSVVASHYPVQFLVQSIGGDAVQVESLTAPGAEPHDLELSPQQVADVQQALSRMQQSLSGLVGEVRASSESIATASAEIATGNHDLISRAAPTTPALLAQTLRDADVSVQRRVYQQVMSS